MFSITSILTLLIASTTLTSALPATNTRRAGNNALTARTYNTPSGFYNCVEFGVGFAKFCKCVQTWNYQHKRSEIEMSPAYELLEVRGTDLEGLNHEELQKRTFEIQKCQIPARGYSPVFLSIGGCCDNPCQTPCGSGCCTPGENCQSGVPVKPPKHGHQWKRGAIAEGVDLTRCPTGGDKKSARYEYLDVKSNIESCGGCVFRDPSSKSSNETAPLGQDCTAIPHVADVACQTGACIIKSCERGFVLQDNRCVMDGKKVLQLQKYRL